MKQHLLFILIITFQLGTFTQSTYPNNEFYINQEVMPEYPGGEKAMVQFLIDNLQEPDGMKHYNLVSKVVVRFTINEDGSLTDFETIRDIAKSGCGDEVIRVLKLMPIWKPGTQFGKVVPVKYTIPITFPLENYKVQIQKYLSNKVIKE